MVVKGDFGCQRVRATPFSPGSATFFRAHVRAREPFIFGTFRAGSGADIEDGPMPVTGRASDLSQDERAMAS